MYILAKTGQQTVYPYSIRNLIVDNPNVSFSLEMTDSQLAEWSVYPVVKSSRPPHDANYSRLVEDTPVLTDGVWTQLWRIEFFTEVELLSLARSRQEEINVENREYLAFTDWYLIRKMETGIEVPAEILSAREAARDAIVQIV